MLPENVPLAISTIKAALENGELDPVRIEESCKKVLMFKYKAGLNQYRPALIENLENDLNKPQYNDLVQTLYNEAVTVLRNHESVLPLQTGSGEWVLVSIGKKAENLDGLENKFPD